MLSLAFNTAGEADMSVQLRFVGLRNHLLALILCAPIAVAAGPVVGLGPYYITGIQVVSLGTLGGTESVARDVNDRGEVVGWAKDSSGVRRPFLFHNAMSDLMPGSPIIGEAHE
jgi:probable HAF family extracellular repeat protein